MSVESDKYYFEFIHKKDNDECNCDECKRDKLENQIPFLLEDFGLSFIPIEFDENLAYKYSYDSYSFYHLWDKLVKLKEYNERMKSKKEQSGTIKSLVHCVQCGKLTYKNKNRAYNDDQLCLVCARMYKECTYCHNLFNSAIDPMRKIVVLEDNNKETVEHVCSSCYNINDLRGKVCESCGKYHRNLDNMVKIILKRDNNDNIIYTRYCSQCGAWFHKCETLGCKELANSSERFCSACQEDELGLMNYDFKPIRRRFNYSSNEKNIDINTSLFFGFEIEVEAEYSKISKETMALLVKEVVGKDYIYCMKDGSLTNGIEIASYPYTWDWYKEIGKDKWTNMLLYLKSKGWRAEYEAHPVGLHVHTTKAAWSNLQVYKLIQFVYNPSNRKFIDRIAGRGPMTYCQISSSDYDRSIKLAKDKKNVSMGHYNMINLNRKDDTTKGGKTIEFRMFKGSLEPYTVHKNLEFVQATFMFTRDNPKKSMFATPFKDYVLNNPKEYPCLSEFIRNLNKKGM